LPLAAVTDPSHYHIITCHLINPTAFTTSSPPSISSLLSQFSLLKSFLSHYPLLLPLVLLHTPIRPDIDGINHHDQAQSIRAQA
jgi:hypothetical protein